MASDAATLTRSFKRSQNRRAALIAALVSLYFRSKVKIEDPQAVDRFLELMVPKILEEHDSLSESAALYGNRLRKIEVPDTTVDFEFQPIRSITEEQIRESLLAVGVNSYLKKVSTIREMDPKQFDAGTKAAMIREADRVASERVASAVARHVQNGPRRTIEDNVKQDPLTIGFVRVTKAKPCFFCAMLASRGLDGGLYQQDSFDLSDPRFIGTGNAKVHDGCGCSLKPVYTRADEILAENQKFTDMWYDFAGDGDSDPLTNFRRNYEGRESHLKK